MDKLTRYGEIIKKILTEYYQIVKKSPDFHPENCLIFDDNHHHYIWRSIDWVNKKRVNNTHIYIRIKDGKIQIEEDWTEEGIANELLREGVPKSDIVLAFHDPETRKLTEFAIA
jgi:hypothetical protein